MNINEHLDEVHSHVHSSNILEGHHKMNINELNEHIWGVGKIFQDKSLNLLDSIQYECHISHKK